MALEETGQQSRKTAFVFLAAGGQRLGMWNHLMELGKHPVDLAKEVLYSHEAAKLEEVCTYGPAEELDHAQMTNLSVYCQSWATYEFLKERGIKPDIVVGYSLGEYAALAAANVCGFPAGLAFLSHASKVYQDAFPTREHGMLGITGVDCETLRQACRTAAQDGAGQAYVSNYNGPVSHILSGELGALEHVDRLVKQSNPKVSSREVKVFVPSHTPLVRDVESRLRYLLDAVLLNDPEIPLISCTNARRADKLDDIKLNMAFHLSSPVYWKDTVDTMLLAGVNTFVEIGPGYGLMKGVQKMAQNLGVNVEAYTTTNLKGVHELLGGFGKI